MNPALTQWGPERLLLLGIVLGVSYNNRSIAHLDTRISDLIRHSEVRHNDLKDLIKSEIKRLEDRIERFERPIVRP